MLADSAATRVTGDILRRSAERSPERPAIVFDGESVSYAELDRMTQQCAHALAEHLVPGAKIGFMLSNSPAYAVGLYGAARSGCVSVHVSPPLHPFRARLRVPPNRGRSLDRRCQDETDG